MRWQMKQKKKKKSQVTYKQGLNHLDKNDGFFVQKILGNMLK